ncbi:MAG TPA: sigma 54-interacting transcriptional regulator [Vicinamibacterales bacterium]|nr:sigma 54-interacting transcriptional regulator [Vicinamibacterales bacterium]
MRPWSLTTALAVVEPDVWSATPFAAVGLVMTTPDGSVRHEMHSRLVAVAHLLTRGDLPPVLWPAPAAGVSVGRLSAGRDVARAVDRITSTFSLDSVVMSPIGTDAAPMTMFAALDAGRAIEDAEIDVFERLVGRVRALADGGEPRDVRERRLTRLSALSQMLPTLTGALDVRDVFDRLSALTREMLPHDSAIVGVFEDGGRSVRLHALSAPAGWTLPPVMPNYYPDAMTSAWEFALHHHLSLNPLERDRPTARLGIESTIRLPLYWDGRIRGILVFNSREPNRYTLDDVIVTRRVADYVALALSHQRLAEQVRDAAAVRERAAQRELLDGLLRTIAGALDLRDVFARLSEVSEKAIAHDAMSVSVPSPDKQRLTIHVATGALGHLATPFDQPTPAPRLLNDHWDYELVDDLPNHPEFHRTMATQSGMVSMLALPVWVEGRLGASVNFFSRRKAHFTRDDVLVGRRIADHIAVAMSHQRLAEEERQAVELRARAANLELLDQLLATMTDATELRELFDRVSAVIKKVIPHDAVGLPVIMPDGIHARRYASVGLDFGVLPEIVPVPPAFVRDGSWDHDIIDEAANQSEWYNRQMATMGFHSIMRVPIRIDGVLAGGLAFMSRAPRAYSNADIVAARRVADRFALCLSRERQAEASRRADEASERAARLEARVRALTDELDARTGYQRVVGQSAAWKRALTQATQVAGTDTTVLLLGESGTGKEVIARFLHRASSRARGPFIALNCAALPEQLLEAELFGYERGAFTGATQSKPGQLELAGGGTLFLDEVGEMSLPAQAKFLRVLQEREFQRLGGTRVLKTDARIVAATNRDLKKMITQAMFREDLYYRLNVFAIGLPPLRERPDDVMPLAEAFLAEYGLSLGRPPSGISRDARERLRGYHWPGNVRELRNILERAAIVCEGGLITGEHLALGPSMHGTPVDEEIADAVVEALDAREPALAAPPRAAAAAGDLKSMERELVVQALQQARFNKSKAAKSLGITRAQLYVRMRRYGLE